MKFNEDRSIEISWEDVLAPLFIIWSWIRKNLKRTKNIKGKVGIVIAISTENDKEKLRLENDLVKGLRERLINSNLSTIFNIISISEDISKKIIDKKSAEKYLNSVKAHLIIYGNISERKVSGENNYTLKLWCLVKHSSIPQIVSNVLSQDFTSVFPNKELIPEKDELLGFEITQEWLWLVIKYIIGLAAYITLDFDLAFKVYSDLEKDIESTKSKIPGIIEIKKRLPLRLIEVSNSKCAELYFKYEKDRNENNIKYMKPFIDLISKYIPNDYQMLLNRSLYLFLIENNIEGAINELIKIKNPLDKTWKYNLAFLYAFKGDLDKSKKTYDNAFKGYLIGSNVINDVEIFFEDLIKKYPSKYELYFARGYVSFKAKGDLSIAKDDFSQFLSLCPFSKFPEEQRLAKIYVKQITAELKKNNN